MSGGSKAPERVAVTIVSTNPETLDGLRAYLCGADVEAECASVVEDVPEAITAECRALVIFPDDFPPHSIESTLDTLHDRHPNVRLILVTRTPKKFERRRKGASAAPIVVTRPAWGWTILDAIHGRLDSNRKEPH